jgi:outer membrane protein TolC
LSRLFESNSWSHVVGPSFIWPVFRAKTIRNNIRVNEALLEERIAQYEQTVLVAVEEVNNAIVAYNQERIRRDALRRAVEASKLSVEGVLQLYREGKTNFQNVLDTQRTLFLSQVQLDASEGEVVVNLIALYKALGGGWDPRHHCHRECVRLSPPETIETIYEVDEADTGPLEKNSGVQGHVPSLEELPSGTSADN